MAENVEIIFAQNDDRVTKSNDRIDKGVDAIAKSWREAAKQALQYAGVSERALKTTPWQNGQMQRGISGFVQAQRVQIQQLTMLRRSASSVASFGGPASFNAQSRGIAGLAASYLGLRSAINLAVNSGREFIEQRDEAVITKDVRRREFEGQSGLRGVGSDQAIARIDREAIRSGLGNERTYEAATQMVSSGFSPQEASGGSLKAFNQALTAANLAGRKNLDFRELAESTSMFLSSQELDKSETNVRDVLGAMQGLYKTTNLQFSEFVDFASKSVGLRKHVPWRQQLAMFATVRDVAPAEESATYIRNFFRNLATSGSEPEVGKALGKIRLTPDKVDMVGETALEAMERFRDGLEKVPSNIQDEVLKTLFGQRGAGVGEFLLRHIPQIKENLEKQGTPESLAADAAHAQAGPAVQAERQTAAREQALARYGPTRTSLGNELDLIDIEEGRSPFIRAWKKWQSDFLRYVGTDEAFAFGHAYGADQTRLGKARADAKAGPEPKSNEAIEAEVRSNLGNQMLDNFAVGKKKTAADFEKFRGGLGTDKRSNLDSALTRRKIKARSLLTKLRDAEEDPENPENSLHTLRGQAQEAIGQVPEFDPSRRSFEEELNGGAPAGAAPATPTKQKPSAATGRNNGREVDLIQWLKNLMTSLESNTSAVNENNRLMSRGSGGSSPPQTVGSVVSPVSSRFGRVA